MNQERFTDTDLPISDEARAILEAGDLYSRNEKRLKELEQILGHERSVQKNSNQSVQRTANFIDRYQNNEEKHDGLKSKLVNQKQSTNPKKPLPSSIRQQKSRKLKVMKKMVLLELAKEENLIACQKELDSLRAACGWNDVYSRKKLHRLEMCVNGKINHLRKIKKERKCDTHKLTELNAQLLLNFEKNERDRLNLPLAKYESILNKCALRKRQQEKSTFINQRSENNMCMMSIKTNIWKQIMVETELKNIINERDKWQDNRVSMELEIINNRINDKTIELFELQNARLVSTRNLNFADIELLREYEESVRVQNYEAGFNLLSEVKSKNCERTETIVTFPGANEKTDKSSDIYERISNSEMKLLKENLRREIMAETVLENSKKERKVSQKTGVWYETREKLDKRIELQEKEISKVRKYRFARTQNLNPFDAEILREYEQMIRIEIYEETFFVSSKIDTKNYSEDDQAGTFTSAESQRIEIRKSLDIGTEVYISRLELERERIQRSDHLSSYGLRRLHELNQEISLLRNTDLHVHT